MIRLGIFFCLFSIFMYADKVLEIEVDRHMPTDVLLEMIANSPKLSGFQKIGMKFWISQRGVQLKRVMAHVESPQDFESLKRDIQRGMHLENVSYDAQEGIKDALKAIECNTRLVNHVENSLKKTEPLCQKERQEVLDRCMVEKQEDECDLAKKLYKHELIQYAGANHRAFVDEVVRHFNVTA